MSSAKQPRDAFIPAELDDMGLSPDAFRAYIHLVRRAGRDYRAHPTYESIGEHCWRKHVGPDVKPDSLRQRAKRAIAELVDAGLIRVEQRMGGKNYSRSNVFHLLPVRSRKDGDQGGSNHGSGGTPEYRQGVHGSTVEGVHGSTPEGSPFEGSPREGEKSGALRTPPSSDDEQRTASAPRDGGEPVTQGAAQRTSGSQQSKRPAHRGARAEPVAQERDAVTVYVEITQKHPKRAQAEMMRARVKNPTYWRMALTHWQLSGWNPRNVEGMIDLYGRIAENDGELPTGRRREPENVGGISEEEAIRIWHQQRQQVRERWAAELEEERRAAESAQGALT